MKLTLNRLKNVIMNHDCKKLKKKNHERQYLIYYYMKLTLNRF